MNKLVPKMLVLAGALTMFAAAMANSVDATVLIDRAANDTTLTVRYSGASVALVELRINGRSAVTRNVSDKDTTGETNFDLTALELEDGDNEIEVRVFDAAGQMVGSEKTMLNVRREQTGPIFLSKPLAGDTVEGPVTIAVGFRREMRDVYVSFFINDEFKALKNTPPYSYLWDTTRISNGWHTVQAWVVDGTNNTFKTERLRIFVNNPGGRTDRIEDDTVALDTSSNPTTANPGEAAGTKPVEGAGTPVEAGQPTPAPRDSGAVGTGTATPPIGDASGAKPVSLPGGTPTDQRILTPTGERMAPVENPVETPVETPVDTTGTDLVAMAPTQPIVDAATVTIGYGTRLPDLAGIAITLNGAPVQFDVMPRIENGVPLTPFRHLFEHAGGKVKWLGESQQVEANGLGRDILLTIGNPLALINGNSVQLERAPFIESGRTIVPLSFMREALDVEIRFDQATGHVLITNR